MFHGNISKVDSPTHHPSQCGYCGVSYDREFYIDTGLSFEWEGHLYICNMCVDQYRVAMGWSTAEQVAEIELNYENQLERYQGSVETLERVGEKLSALSIETLLEADKDERYIEPELSEPVDSSELGSDSSEQGIDVETSGFHEPASIFDFS